MAGIDELDEQQVRAKIGLLGGLMASTAITGVVVLGLRLGLYAALGRLGVVTSEQLANETGLHERWVREWLRAQASAGVIEYEGDGRFTLSPGAAALLSDRDGPRFMGGAFYSLPLNLALLPRLEESFRTGIGLSWDDRGERASEATEGTFRTWYLHHLVQDALPLLDGVVDRLRAGATAADVGCGTGVAVVEMAKAFPASEFHGYELSEHALARAEEHRARAGVTNVAFHHVATDPLPAAPRFDFITTFDCLHDMAQPAQYVAAIRNAILPDGTWFIADINGQPTFEENLATNPLARLYYSTSILSCMSSAMSEPGGAGLGTLGLPEPAMRDLVTAAGFSRFRRVELAHPVNAFYEVRP